MHRFHGIQRRFHIQRIERRLDEQQVHAALDEGFDLLAVARRHLVEAVRPLRRPGDVRRERQRLGGRADAAGHPDLPAGLVGRGAGNPGPGAGHLPRMGLQPVLLLGDPVRAEGIGFNDVGPGGYVGLVYGRNDVRPRQVQALVVALQGNGRIRKDTLPEIFFRQAVTLNLGAHRPIQPQHLLPQGIRQIHTTYNPFFNHCLQRYKQSDLHQSK